ncbi:MAG TPA: gamma carbonic anhydrase family protein [Burkholderiales bacterium]|jgi:carbonic anhydrase/acetyltransferase-like protein (isoleucine patch superfamily)
MPIYSLGERTPKIAPDAYVAPNAQVIGSVTMGPKSNVWFNAVLRSDNEVINLAEGVNVQDGAVLHADPGFPLNIARNVTIGHLAMVHGCTIEENTLIGINAVILNGAKIGKNCIIGANALIGEGKVIPDGSMVLGSPGKVTRETRPEEHAHLTKIAEGYINRAARYKKELTPISEGVDEAFLRQLGAGSAQP